MSSPEATPAPDTAAATPAPTPAGQRVMTLPEGVATMREFQRNGRIEDARRLGQALLRAAPANADIFTVAASVEMAAGRPDLALPLVERATALDSNNADRFSGYGKVLRALGRDVEAAAVYERALTIIANSPPRIDAAEFAKKSPTHHFQHRPINHVQFRKSRHFDSLLTTWLEGKAGGEPDDMARFYFLADNIGRTLARGVPGALAELGVWRGATAKIIRGVAPGRTVYLFDSFKGFPEGQLPEGDARAGLYKDTSAEAVRNYVGTDEVAYCVGAFPETTAQVPEATRFAFVHLDCKTRAPVEAGLEFFYPRLNPGGLLAVHDFGNDQWPEVAQAVDEFLAGKPEGMVLLPDKGGTGVLMKA